LLADGPEPDVEAFLADVRERMAAHVETEEVTDRDAGGLPDGFRIVG
jgi:hypothetical protein